MTGRLPAAAFAALLALAACKPELPDGPPQPPLISAPAIVVSAIEVPAVEVPAVETPIEHEPLVRCLNPVADYTAQFKLAAVRADMWGDPAHLAKFLAAVGCVESRYDNTATGPTGDKCVVQFSPDTASDYGVDLDDPVSCINAGGKFYAWHGKLWCPRGGGPGERFDRTREQCDELRAASGNRGQGRLLDQQAREGCVNWDCFEALEDTPLITRRHVAAISRLMAGGVY